MRTHGIQSVPILNVRLYSLAAEVPIIWVLINKSLYWAFIYFLLIICITEHSIFFTEHSIFFTEHSICFTDQIFCCLFINWNCLNFSLSSIYRVIHKYLYDKKFEYLHYGSSKWADFFINDRDMFKVYIHKDMPRETLS